MCVTGYPIIDLIVQSGLNLLNSPLSILSHSSSLLIYIIY